MILLSPLLWRSVDASKLLVRQRDHLMIRPCSWNRSCVVLLQKTPISMGRRRKSYPRLKPARDKTIRHFCSHNRRVPSNPPCESRKRQTEFQNCKRTRPFNATRHVVHVNSKCRLFPLSAGSRYVLHTFSVFLSVSDGWMRLRQQHFKLVYYNILLSSLEDNKEDAYVSRYIALLFVNHEKNLFY